MNIKIKHCSYHDTVTMVQYIMWLVIHQGFDVLTAGSYGVLAGVSGFAQA